MSPELIRLESLKLALAHRAMSTKAPVEAAKEYEQYIAGHPEKSGPEDTRKDEGEAAPKPRKTRSAQPAP